MTLQDRLRLHLESGQTISSQNSYSTCGIVGNHLSRTIRTLEVKGMAVKREQVQAVNFGVDRVVVTIYSKG